MTYINDIITNHMLIDYDLTAAIMNRHIQNSGFGAFGVTAKEIEWDACIKEYSLISTMDENFCTKIFNSLAIDHSKEEKTLYHYKSKDIALAILKTGVLQASHMLAQSRNDAEEYAYFLKQIGHPLSEGGRPIPPGLLRAFTGFSGVDVSRDLSFTLSFTRNNKNPKFWIEYADNHNGICFVMKYRPLADRRSIADFKPLYYLRDMVYDNASNNRFAFFNEMNKELLDKIGYEFMVSEVPQFAKFYKRFPYTWEDEIRLAIDLKYLLASNAFYFSPEITYEMDGERKYIPIGFANAKFPLIHLLPMQIELSEVIVGKNISDSDFNEIFELTNQNFTASSVRRNIDD